MENYKKIGRIDAPQKTFFYERRDGSVIAMSENEAALTGKFYRLLGTSDGTTYFRLISELHKKAETLTDEEVAKCLTEAFNAELEVAKNHIERPRNMAVTDLEGKPSQRFNEFLK